MRDTFKDMITVTLPYSGEKDIDAAHQRRHELQDTLEHAKRELAAVDEWLADTMPTDTYRTKHGTLVRKTRRVLRSWRNDEWRRDALRASARHDGATRRPVDPDTGEVMEMIDAVYAAGWEAANRIVTLSGNLAKVGGKKLLYKNGLGYDDEYAEQQVLNVIEEVEDTL